MKKHTPPLPCGQTGVVLLESLIAILVFSMGILALVGMQGFAVQAASDAKYRSDAAFLANEVIGQMWVSDRTPDNLEAHFSSELSDASGYQNWSSAVANTLPGVDANNKPSIEFDATTPGQVTITICWKVPKDEESAICPHSYRVVTQIGG